MAPQTSTALPVTLSNPAAAGGVLVTLSSSDTSRVTVNPSSIYIAAGATAPYIQPQVTGLNFGTANVTAAAFGLAGDTETVRVAASLFGPASTTVTRGTTQNITLVISAPTPAALSLALRSDKPTVAGVPSSATIPANGTSAIVPITGAAAGSTVIRISAAGIAERALDVTVMAPGSITLPVVTVPLGQTVPFPVRLGTPAPSGGVTLTLTSSKTTTMRVSPAGVFIPAGATAPSSQPQVTGVNIGAATITATAPGYSPASQSVPVPATISFSPTSLTITQPGTSQKLLLALSHSAPWGQDGNLWGDGAGVTVQLSSSNPNVAAVPATVDLYPDGSSFTTVLVLVRGIAPGTATIRASAPPFIPEITASVAVLP